jgi:hypothetical protein
MEPNGEPQSILGARRGMTLGQRLREPDAYGLLLIMTLAVLIASALAGRSPLASAVVIVLQGGVLLFAFWTARTRPRLLRAALVLVPVVVIAAGILAGAESDEASAVVSALSALLAGGAIAAIARRLGTHPRVDAATMLGALSTYLLIGMFYASVFSTLSKLSDVAFFVGQSAPRSVDFLYFSYVTIATVGYGDLTAATDLGRMIAVTEALTGQLYLVTVVALVVGNIGRERTRP